MMSLGLVYALSGLAGLGLLLAMAAALARRTPWRRYVPAGVGDGSLNAAFLIALALGADTNLLWLRRAAAAGDLSIRATWWPALMLVLFTALGLVMLWKMIAGQRRTNGSS